MNLIDAWGLTVKAVCGGRITRVGWQDPRNHDRGFGWRVYISNPNGDTDIYGHMDPDTTPWLDEEIEPGEDIGEYADPTNGHSSGPHLHFERRDSDNTPLSPPIDDLPIPNGRITTPFEQVDDLHPRGHRGIDIVNP
jgi:murein DD-endopeptidase MepM/ murein hydrolase activator NlpD